MSIFSPFVLYFFLIHFCPLQDSKKCGEHLSPLNFYTFSPLGKQEMRRASSVCLLCPPSFFYNYLFFFYTCIFFKPVFSFFTPIFSFSDLADFVRFGERQAFLFFLYPKCLYPHIWGWFAFYSIHPLLVFFFWGGEVGSLFNPYMI